MRYRYPVPTESPFSDFCQYIPLLISAVQEELDRDSVWNDSEAAQARNYIQDLYAYLELLECSGIMDYSKKVGFTQATSSPLTLDSSPPKNSILTEIVLIIDSASGGSVPTFSVGVSGSVSLYAATENFDLKTVGQYAVYPYAMLGSSPATIIATMSAASATYSGSIILRYAKL
jgi:hypothetical protein